MAERVVYFDILKALAIIGVVVLHVSAQGVSYEEILSYNWYVCNFYDSFVRCSVPLFCMVTGALFLDTKREINVKKNFKRILFALIFWRLIYALLVNGVRYPLFSQEWLIETLRYFLLHSGHTWYLYMLLGFYMILPILQQIASSEKAEKYFLLVWFAFSVLPILEVIPKIGDVVVFVKNSMNVNIIAGFSGYFLLGHFLSNYKSPILMNTISLALIGLGGVLSVSIGTVLLTEFNGSLTLLLYNYTSLFVIIISTCVFLLAKRLTIPTKKYGYMMQIISNISQHSLGIYLIHILYLVALDKLGLNYVTFNPVLCVPVVSMVIMIASFFTVKLMSLFPLFRKFI